MKYKDIRKEYQDHNYLEKVFVDPYAMLVSPLFTKIFVKKNIKPNYVTIMMILSGIVGAVFFSFNNILMKILGIVFIHTWYILDCSDGEVARITKTFSKFGAEIDYTAHVINHPLFNIAFTLSIISLNRYNNVYICLLFMISIIFDLANRNVTTFYTIYNYKIGGNDEAASSRSLIKKVIIYVIAMFVDYPNFALIFPFVYLFDVAFRSNFCIIYTCIVVFFQIIIISRILFKWILKIKDL